MVMAVSRGRISGSLPQRGGVGFWSSSGRRVPNPHPSPPLKGEGTRFARKKVPASSISQRLGVVAVAGGDQLVLDAAHGGDGSGAEAGGDGLGQDVERGEKGVAAGRGAEDIGIFVP